jgi:hypothetical protein
MSRLVMKNRFEVLAAANYCAVDDLAVTCGKARREPDQMTIRVKGAD